MKTLAILFAGHPAKASFVDGMTGLTVHVRAMPQRFLGAVIKCAEFKHALVELCCYIKADAAAESSQSSASSHPDIPPPAGYEPVPLGWSDNLTDESIDALYDAAKALNFQRAIAWAQGQIAAKKLVAPLHEAAIQEVLPLALKILEPLMKKLETLSASMPSSQSSAVTPASSS